MNKPLLRKLILLFAVILFLQKSQVEAQVAVLINEDITWEWQMPKWYGGNAFYWWHRKDVKPNTINFGEMSPTDWTVPYDYWNGTFYFRFIVESQPTSSPFSIQLGIWQDISRPGGWLETCSPLSYLSGGAGSSVEHSIGTPNNWWEIRSEEDVDFKRPEDFYRIGMLLWKGNGACIPYGQTYSASSSQCSDPTTEAAKFFPLTGRLTVVAVAKNATFPGWDAYPVSGGGTPKQPTPTYGIDYVNECTNKIVPSTDEYAYSYSMTSKVSGNGQILTLTPGKDVYFRTKASADLAASNIQTLDVSSRPSAPTFAYDAVNKRTTTTVSSAYEYSTSSSMNGATAGTGTYVSIPTGTTMYFRKKATSSAFASNIQTLTGTSTPPTGSPEFVIINDIIEWPNTTDDNGFYFFYHNNTMPVNWLSPYDFYNGQIYTRFEILEQPTTQPMGLQFGIWQKLPPQTGTLYETMGPYNAMTGPGSVVIKNNSPSTWWKLDGLDIDWTQMDKVWHFGINPWKNTSTQIRSENTAAWAERFTYWFPLRVRATVIAVANGHTFSGWDNYITPGGVPEYQIDFDNENTSTVVTSSDEYSLNQTSWTSGNNAKMALTPGTDVYFRKKISPTQIQHLVVPAREAAPAFAIDYINEVTSTNASSAYEYSGNSNMTSAVTASNAGIPLTPGSNIYIRKKATSTSFASAIQTLVVQARPEKPQIGINFIAEKTNPIAAMYVYSTNEDMSSPVTGNGTAVALSPGATLYIQTPATASSFKSAKQELVAPARPAAPAVGIDYANETTSIALTSSYIISPNANMTSSAAGSNAKIKLTPGTDLYIQLKATSTQYASEIKHLDVPERPTLSVTLASPLSVTSVPVNIHFPSAVTGFVAEDIMVVNGHVSSLTGSYVATIVPDAPGNVLVSIPSKAVNEGNFASFAASFKYQLATGIDDQNEEKFIVYPTIVKDWLYVEHNESSSIDYEIIDISGTIVQNGYLKDSKSQIQVSNISNGVYLIRFSSEEDKKIIETFRFIKE